MKVSQVWAQNVLVALDQILRAYVCALFRLFPFCFCGLLQAKLCMLKCIYPFKNHVWAGKILHIFVFRTVMWFLGKSVAKAFLTEGSRLCVGLAGDLRVYFSFPFNLLPIYIQFYRKLQLNLRQDLSILVFMLLRIHFVKWKVTL